MSGPLADAKDIFLNALDCESPHDLARYLDEACAGDAALRTRVEDLLRARRDAGDFLGGDWSLAGAGQAPLDEAPGAVIGPYKLLEQVGEGGFGVVFGAEQQRPVRRDVALKIIKLGMDTKQVVARFEAERQALAMMDHPGIAKVFDAGTTDSGRPYFVMELVRGVPITDFCDQNKLGIEQRLNLFVQVCQAVQHAHQKGLIHRDIKPTNVLVARQDTWPAVKVIDFGIAKATQSRLTEKTLFTDLRQLIGTPEYMSPEQAGGSADVDTRSDVYSLGVLLYELLTGAPPFDPKELRSKAFAEVQRIIREVEPPKPSTRLSTLKDKLPSVAAQRATEPRRLDSVIRGDLDWITMKALEKDRGRRYESAAALAADILHHLADEPVSAVAPSRVYRITKFVQRNKLSVFATAAVIAALVAGVIGTTIAMIGQSRQRAQAEAATEQLAAVNEFLTKDVLAGAEPSRLPDKAVRDEIVRVMIDPAAATVAERFRDKPLVEAAVRHALSSAYEAVGRGDLALPHARRALEIRRRELGNDHPDTLAAIAALGALLQSLGRLDEAERLLGESLARSRRVLGDDAAETIVAITSLAIQRQQQGRFGEAERLFREAFDRSREKYGEDDELTIMAVNNLGYILLMEGDLKAAEPLVKEALERAERELGENHRGTMRAIDNMGALLSRHSKFTEAEAYWSRGLELCRRVLGNDDPYTLHAINDMAGLLMEQGKFDEGYLLAQEALQRRQRTLGEDHPDALISLNNLGLFMRRWGKLDEAEPISEEALKLASAASDEHPNTLYAMCNLGELYTAQNRLKKAEPLLLEVLELAERTLPRNHPLVATAYYNLGDLRMRQERLDEAMSQFEKALALRQETLGDENVDTAYARHGIANVLHLQGKAAEGLPILRDVLAKYLDTFDPDQLEVGMCHLHMGQGNIQLKNWPEAEAELTEAERILGLWQERQHDLYERTCQDFAVLYEAWEKAEPGHGHSDKAAAWRARLTAEGAAPDSASPDEDARQVAPPPEDD